MNIGTIRISTILLIIPLFSSITGYALSVAPMDTDNDGIPNAVEKKIGLDPDNPDDALYDMDYDGFPNIFEFKNATRINSAKSHPPLYMRLHLLEFKKTLLPSQFTLINMNDDKKKPAEWAIKIRGVGSIFTIYKYLGSTMFLDKTHYTITKIDVRHVDKRQGGSLVKIDKSKVYLKSKDGKYSITMQAGKPVYSPRLKAVIEDLGTGKMYHVGEGDTISMFLRAKQIVSKETGIKLRRRFIKYKVLKVDMQKKQVIIEDTKKRNPKKYVLTTKAFMPRPIKVVKTIVIK